MKPIDPEGMPGRRVVLGEAQPEYEDLVAMVTDERAHTRWELSDEEREAIAGGASIELITWTFGQPFQPVYLRVQGVEEEAVTVEPAEGGA